MSEFMVVAEVSQLPVGATLAVAYLDQEVGLFNVRGTIYAIGNVCTHAYAQLHEGYVDDDDCTVDCPLHGARFSLQTGNYYTLPAVRNVACYIVQIDGTQILIAPAS